MLISHWKPLLLLVAILMATVRPVLATNGSLSVLVNTRSANSESNESEDESEREAEGCHESKRARRVNQATRSYTASHRSKTYLRASRPQKRDLPNLVPGTEHGNRNGLGTPLRN